MRLDRIARRCGAEVRVAQSDARTQRRSQAAEAEAATHVRDGPAGLVGALCGGHAESWLGVLHGRAPLQVRLTQGFVLKRKKRTESSWTMQGCISNWQKEKH